MAMLEGQRLPLYLEKVGRSKQPQDEMRPPTLPTPPTHEGGSQSYILGSHFWDIYLDFGSHCICTLDSYIYEIIGFVADHVYLSLWWICIIVVLYCSKCMLMVMFMLMDVYVCHLSLDVCLASHICDMDLFFENEPFWYSTWGFGTNPLWW